MSEPIAQKVFFDYEAKQWGSGPVRPRPWYVNGLKLRYLLDDLSRVDGRALDVGCGAGSVAKGVKRERPDLEVFGCDLSEAALATARVAPEGVDFRLATAERLPLGMANSTSCGSSTCSSTSRILSWCCVRYTAF